MKYSEGQGFNPAVQHIPSKGFSPEGMPESYRETLY